ncbi:hypothetical protein [Cryobacterium sp. Y11]|uniref:hypothetical protein n=1 Tax=Cryobacterium sp. Y11 TaxID=2045016 RepID=UPI001E60F311|nr:hypothetical protein [Cryobacterium sp. Y11]
MPKKISYSVPLTGRGTENAALPRHLRAINADRGGRQLDGLDRSHTHRISHGRFLPLLLRTQQPLKRAQLTGGIDKLLNLGSVRAQLPRSELPRPREKISQRSCHVALIPADRADQTARQRNTLLEDVEIVTTKNHEIVTITARNPNLALVNVRQNLFGLSQKVGERRSPHTQTLHQINI